MHLASCSVHSLRVFFSGFEHTTFLLQLSNRNKVHSLSLSWSDVLVHIVCMNTDYDLPYLNMS